MATVDDWAWVTATANVQPRGTGSGKRMTLDFSKPAPAHDEETGEYLGYWWVDGKRVEAPDDASAPVV
ncbi:hypothetical protein KBY91_19165 [Streptomyces sp. RK23]|uniref:hypothetical protein n=1 Tax=unclassified Streptomyces TaxID=2593676 RepID=UPI001B397014|nr:MULTISPECIES: hypothetical protein [unclassified Streptomyces]MBQ0963471.1 hypothetical protein [Streptomyces sp. RK74B]MBQ1005527.1 hypothetical protein [Streptomyces sp. RK23]